MKNIDTSFLSRCNLNQTELVLALILHMVPLKVLDYLKYCIQVFLEYHKLVNTFDCVWNYLLLHSAFSGSTKVKQVVSQCLTKEKRNFPKFILKLLLPLWIGIPVNHVQLVVIYKSSIKQFTLYVALLTSIL